MSLIPRLIVTVLFGFLCAGETTDIHHVLTNGVDARAAVIVNEMSEYRLDVALLRKGGANLDHVLVFDLPRSNGLVCTALTNDWSNDRSQADCSVRINPVGSCWAAASEDQWPGHDEEIHSITSEFTGTYGDRRQKLVFVGNAMDEARVYKIMRSCLVMDLKFPQSPDFWQRLLHTLPSVQVQKTEVEVVA